MIANTHYGYVGKSKAPKFTYTGNYKVRDDGVVELLTSGTIVFLEPKVIDLFMVGGGGGGGSAERGAGAWGGGGGGYTRTIRRISITKNASIAVTVGAGANSPVSSSAIADGESSAFGDLVVAGGKSVSPNTSNNTTSSKGANGGSGGGGGRYSLSTGGMGGSNGENGENGSATGGVGQRYPTREFNEATGKLYAGGGGGGTYIVANTPVYAVGGSGGGGAGAWCGAKVGSSQAPSAGGANTGGGGGGGCATNFYDTHNGASGGSGIVCFRESMELPELAGTWVLNEKLYAPETMPLTENVNFSSTDEAGGAASENNQCIFRTQYGVSYFEIHSTSLAKTVTVYTFNTDSWTNKWTRLTFPAGATASDEFRAWLANNATKQ